MNISRYIVSLLLTAVPISAQQAGQSASQASATTEFATNRAFSKGGLGIVNTNLYIAVKSTKNELLYGEKRTWRGSDASMPEVVLFFEGKVWVPQDLPKGFDLSKAVLISFERDKIRFFDFTKMSGGYYQRTSN